MKQIDVKCTDNSAEDIIKICKKAGFIILTSKHYKIKTSDGKFVTTIPKHKTIKRETARGIFSRLQEFGANIAIIK